MTLALGMDDYPDPSVELLVSRLKTALHDEEPTSVERVKVLEAELVEARKEIQRILSHSHQVQESLEQVFQDDQAKRLLIEEMEHGISELRSQQHEAELRQMKALEDERAKVVDQLSQDHAIAIDQLAQDHATAIDQLSQDYATLKMQLAEKSLELDVALEQLEHYFLQSRQKTMMLEKYEKLQEKSVALLRSSCVG